MTVPSSYTESTRHTDYDEVNFPKFTEKKIEKIFGSKPEPISKRKFNTNRHTSRNSAMQSYSTSKPKFTIGGQ